MAVFDTSEAKIVNYLPLASEDIAFAAGADKLVVVLRDQTLIQRWNLGGAFQRELSKTLATRFTPAAATMGSASNGPIWLREGDSHGHQRLLRRSHGAKTAAAIRSPMVLDFLELLAQILGDTGIPAQAVEECPCFSVRLQRVGDYE